MIALPNDDRRNAVSSAELRRLDDAAFWEAAAVRGYVRPERVDPDQAWFWTREWVTGEIEVDEAVAEGRTTVYWSSEEFLASLEELDRDADVRDGRAIS
jgi:hypothetical protein